MFALHMFDAPILCEAQFSRSDGTGESTVRTLTAPMLHSRIRCDPLVYFHLARRICRESSFVQPDTRLILRARRQSEPALHTVVDIPDFCRQPIHYSALWHNGWIQVQ